MNSTNHNPLWGYNISCAMRTRSKGEWHKGAHYPSLEINRNIMNALTKVAKDCLVITAYELP